MNKKILVQRIKTEPKEPTAEQARGWLSQRTGKYHKAVLHEKLEDLKTEWVNGTFTGSNVEETIQLNSEALGKAQQLADIILTLEEMQIDDKSSEDYTY